jgi:release factor glutamine methyltransferase
VAGRIRFAPADLLESAEPAAFDAVVANLPYVPTARWEALPVHIREYEPRAALDGGPDGLALIARLAPQAAATLRPGGALFLEIGADQAPAVTRLLRDAGFAEPRMVKDLAGHPRVVWAGQAPQGVSADPRGVSNP